MDVDASKSSANPTETPNQKKKKKRAKKDKTAGLLFTISKPASESQPKVLVPSKVTLKPLNKENAENSLQTSQTAQQKSSTKPSTISDENEKKKKAKKDKTAGLSFTLTKHAQQSSHQQKPIQPKVIPNLKKVAKNAKNPAQSSQTAKMNKNSLLKLANALKAKGVKSSANSSHDRLQKMFQ